MRKGCPYVMCKSWTGFTLRTVKRSNVKVKHPKDECNLEIAGMVSAIGPIHLVYVYFYRASNGAMDTVLISRPTDRAGLLNV